MLEDTILVFVSDHGDMMFRHNMVGKRLFYEESAKVPLIFSGNPVMKWKGKVEKKLAQLEDVMPTLLDLCGLPIPDTSEGISLISQQEHPYLYGEIGEGEKASRMIRWESYKLIYYPCGNKFQLFDLKKDPTETHDCVGEQEYQAVLVRMKQYLKENFYGCDLKWLKETQFCGFELKEVHKKADFGLYNQRGYHWPTPSGYTNLGKNG